MADEIQTDAEFQDKNKRFKDNMGMMLEYQLALECYSDWTGDESIYTNEAYSIQKALRANREIWGIDKLLENSEKALSLFDELTKFIGKEHFIFYGDGCMEYKHDHVKNSKNQKEN